MSVLALSQGANPASKQPLPAGASHVAAIKRFAKVAGTFLLLTVAVATVVAAKVFAFLPLSLH